MVQKIVESKELSLKYKLQKIQSKLKVPKAQFNSFGKYKYRKCEDILEAVKPLLENYNLSLILIDDVLMIGNRFYIKSTAKLIDSESDTDISVFALAREPEIMKGMNEAQITGSSSSYARKYALNGLFAIDDDEKDADTQEPVKNSQTAQPEHLSDKQKGLVNVLLKQLNMTKTEFESKIRKPIEKITREEASTVIEKLMAKKESATAQPDVSQVDEQDQHVNSIRMEDIPIMLDDDFNNN